MKYRRLLALLIAMCLLCGCSSALITNEYTVITEHAKAEVEAVTDAVRAENYDELCYGILSIIESGATEGTIHVYNYEGDVPTDVTEAAYDVWKNDPLGAYAVDYITADCTLLVSYYEIRVNITYRDNYTAPQKIEYVRGHEGAKLAITSALEETASALTLRISAFPEWIDCQEIVHAYCAANPEIMMEEPTVEFACYPNEGSTRIMEIRFHYAHTAEETRAMRAAVSGILTSAVNYVRYRQDPAAKAEMLFSYLTERFDYMEGETPTPVYSLLCEGIADSETFALIWQILCERAEIDCQTVAGSLDGEPYSWNIICLGGEYRHVDLMRALRENGGQYILYTDDDMTRYSWDREAFPACTAPEEEAQEETSAEEPSLSPSAPVLPEEPEQEPTDAPDDPQEDPMPEEDDPNSIAPLSDEEVETVDVE